MDIASFLIDFFKYVLAGCIVVGVANWLFWTKYNSHLFRLKVLEARHAAKKEVLPLRLQAYERLVLLVERLNPANLMLRLMEPGMDAKAFEYRLIEEIRNEYQHNITQQLYVSDAAWAVTERIKDQTVALIRNAATGTGGSAKELSAVVLKHLADLAENPYELALAAIKNELGNHL